MRQHRAFKYLMDILGSIEMVEEFSSSLLDVDDYLADNKTRLAIERSLEIVGEATTQLLKIEPDIEISNVKKIVSLRNQISHGYDDIDEVVIWENIKVHLPILKAEVKALLS